MATLTMKMLAERIGVSVATVSNAYSRPDQLSVELRERILTTAAEVGYTGPSATARALRSGKLGICGFLMAGQASQVFSDPYAVMFLAGLSESVQRSGASVLLLQPGLAANREELLQQAPIDVLVGRLGPEAVRGLDVLRRRGVRLVSTHRSPDGDWVSIDDEAAGHALGVHLRSLGHRDAVVVAAGARTDEVEQFRWSPTSRRLPRESFAYGRLRGLGEALGRDALDVVRVDHNSRTAGRRAGTQVLASAGSPTAVVALSDVLAIGVLDAVHELGLTPGHDVSVTGFDDIPDAEFLGITTIRQPVVEKGRLVGVLAMDPSYVPRQITLPTDLVVRRTTGPAPDLRKGPQL